MRNGIARFTLCFSLDLPLSLRLSLSVSLSLSLSLSLSPPSLSLIGIDYAAWFNYYPHGSNSFYFFNFITHCSQVSYNNQRAMKKGYVQVSIHCIALTIIYSFLLVVLLLHRCLIHLDIYTVYMNVLISIYHNNSHLQLVVISN